MQKRRIPIFYAMLLIGLAGILLAGCGSPASSPSSPASAGETLMQQRCTVCHSTARIISAHMTADQWKATVDKMINNGAQLSPTEEQTLVTYLAQTYHP